MNTEIYPAIEKVGRPDFVGTWWAQPAASTFSMYVLKRGVYVPTRGERDPHLEALAGKTESVEGLIVDKYGLAVFSGSLTERSVIRFMKNYSQQARQNGGGGEIEYLGEYDPIGQEYSGNYYIRGTRLSGSFTLKPVAESH